MRREMSEERETLPIPNRAWSIPFHVGETILCRLYIGAGLQQCIFLTYVAYIDWCAHHLVPHLMR